MAALRHAAHLSQGHRNTVKHPRRSGARITETKAFARGAEETFTQPAQARLRAGGGDMNALVKFGVASVLVTSALVSNLVLLLSILPNADAQVRGRPGQGLDWQTFEVAEFGTTVDYPAGIFSEPDGKAEKGIGQRFNRADGRAALTIYARENEDGDTPASYLRKNLRAPRTALDYARVTPSFFAISSERQGIVLYSRCNFSSEAGGAIHCFDLVYPQAESSAWDAIVTRISRSLRPLEG
jgi:hypothetical protein